MIRLAFFIAGLVWLIYLIFQFGPHNIFSIVRTLSLLVWRLGKKA